MFLAINEASEYMLEKYAYLIHHVLCSKYNMDHFTERVREAYFDNLMNGHPACLQDIVDELDQENILTITGFYGAYGYEEYDIDIIISKYSHDISSMLDVWIEDILQNLGFAFTGSAFFEVNKDYTYYYGKNDAQVIVFREFL